MEGTPQERDMNKWSTQYARSLSEAQWEDEIAIRPIEQAEPYRIYCVPDAENSCTLIRKTRRRVIPTSRTEAIEMNDLSNTYYYTGDAEEIKTILRGGFIDTRRTDTDQLGVCVADCPGEPSNDNEELLEITLPASIDTSRWMLGPWEWLIPAHVLHKHARVRQLRKDQWKEACAKYKTLEELVAEGSSRARQRLTWKTHVRRGPAGLATNRKSPPEGAGRISFIAVAQSARQRFYLWLPTPC